MVKKLRLNRLLYIITTILLVLPSFLYLLRRKTFILFNKENYFLQNDSDLLIQLITYFIVIILFIVAYLRLIKKRNDYFKNIKYVFIFIFIISCIFIVVTPFLSSDIYYYLGIGRLSQQYNQNPYYVNMRDFVDKENINLDNDTMLLVGYNNVWSETTVVYGPIWTMICESFSKLSLGNADIGLLVFKIASIVVHMLNCYYIYKISKRKLFVLIYGLNPLVLLDGIGNMHNDLYLLLFTLISLYMITKKNDIHLSLVFLSLSVNIKFVMILLLPFIVLYYLKDKKILDRIIGCLVFGSEFLIITILPFLLYMQDLSIFTCMLVQRERYSNNIYHILFSLIPNFIRKIKDILLIIFFIVYSTICIRILISKKINFRKLINIFTTILLVFIFVLLTNFQTWYLMWLMPFIMWSKTKKIKLIFNIQIAYLISYPVLAFNIVVYLFITFLIFFTITIVQKKYRKKFLILGKNL